jgi:hypothetical protein
MNFNPVCSGNRLASHRVPRGPRSLNWTIPNHSAAPGVIPLRLNLPRSRTPIHRAPVTRGLTGNHTGLVPGLFMSWGCART